MTRARQVLKLGRQPEGFKDQTAAESTCQVKRSSGGEWKSTPAEPAGRAWAVQLASSFWLWTQTGDTPRVV